LDGQFDPPINKLGNCPVGPPPTRGSAQACGRVPGAAWQLCSGNPGAGKGAVGPLLRCGSRCGDGPRAQAAGARALGLWSLGKSGGQWIGARSKWWQSWKRGGKLWVVGLTAFRNFQDKFRFHVTHSASDLLDFLLQFRVRNESADFWEGWL